MYKKINLLNIFTFRILNVLKLRVLYIYSFADASVITYTSYIIADLSGFKIVSMTIVD